MYDTFNFRFLSKLNAEIYNIDVFGDCEFVEFKLHMY